MTGTAMNVPINFNGWIWNPNVLLKFIKSQYALYLKSIFNKAEYTLRMGMSLTIHSYSLI